MVVYIDVVGIVVVVNSMLLVVVIFFGGVLGWEGVVG